MKPRKYNNPPPARTVVPPVGNSSTPPAILTPADEVIVLVGERFPRRWLHVTLALNGTEPAAAAVAAAWFTTRIRVIDKRLRLTIDRQRCVATGGELVLAFAPQHGGSLADEWLEEVKPVVRELASSEFDGAEVKSVEVVVEG